MKIHLISLLAILILSFNNLANASDVQEVQIKKIGDNLYGTKDEKMFIKTKYCYESSYSYEKAILKIDNKYSSYQVGKIIFDNNKTCDVEKIYKESR